MVAGAVMTPAVRVAVQDQNGNTITTDTSTITLTLSHDTFSNGTTYDVPIRFLFLPGTSSRVINLPGVVRHIRRVDMTYNKLIGGGKALVTLEGRKL